MGIKDFSTAEGPAGRAFADLCDQDAHHHAQLVESPKGSTQRSGGHLAHIHGGQACEEPTEQAYDQTAGDNHLIGGADGGEAHEEASNHCKAVDQEHGATPEEEQEAPQDIKQIFSLEGWVDELGGAGSPRSH